MKKAFLVAVIALAFIGIVSAQSWRPGWTRNQGDFAQIVAVTGTLQLRNGTIAVESNNSVYYVPSLERYIGFIDGLKEGATVTIEGYGDRAYLQPSKITLNGKSYDFSANYAQGTSCDGYGYQTRHGRGGHCW
jgi:hypothetical protein